MTAGPPASSQMFQEWELLIHCRSWMTSVVWRNSHTWPIWSSANGRAKSCIWGGPTPCTSPCWGVALQKVPGSPGGQGGCKPVTCPCHKGQKHLGQHWKEHCQQNEGGYLYLVGSDSLKGNRTRHNLQFLFSLRKLIGIVTRWKYCPLVVLSSPLAFTVMSLQKADAGDDADDGEVGVPRRTVWVSTANVLPFTRYESSVIVKIIAAFSWQCLLMFIFPALLSTFKNWWSYWTVALCFWALK